MIDIMHHFTQYVPFIEEESTFNIDSTEEVSSIKQLLVHKILFGGDQLTAAVACSAKRNMANGDSGLSRLECYIPVVEDWHSQLTLLNVRT